MGRIAIFLLVPVGVSPDKGDLAQAVDALRRLHVHIALVARAPSLTAFFAHAAPGGVLVLSALGTEVLRRGLIDVEVAILGAQLALARASLAVAEVAGVALRQSV